MEVHLIVPAEEAKDACEAEGEDIQNSGKASIAVWGRDMVNNKSLENRLEVNKMRMLRWMCGGTEKDKKHIRIAPVKKKTADKMLVVQTC